MNAIYPTYTCFDDALDLLAEAVKANPDAVDSGELRLVHGICLSPSGEKYSHAWVESFGMHVWFMGILNGERATFACSRIEYYEDARVQETTKYTPREAWALNYEHENYGPWIERYKKLCKDAR